MDGPRQSIGFRPMRKRRYLRWAGAGFVVVAVAACALISFHRSLTYRGKSVRELTYAVARQLDPKTAQFPTRQETQEAIAGLRSLGDAGEAELLRQLQTRDNLLRAGYRNYRKRAPRSLQRLLPASPDPRVARMTAIITIAKLGTMSPRLEKGIAGACTDTNTLIRGVALMLLAYRGSPTPENRRILDAGLHDGLPSSLVQIRATYLNFEPKTVEEMVAGLTRLASDARYESARALRELGPAARPAIPALITACHDPDDTVRICCVHALENVGREASNALPTLGKMLNEEQNQTSLAQTAISNAIQRIKAQ